jgi:hypothetical protein
MPKRPHPDTALPADDEMASLSAPAASRARIAAAEEPVIFGGGGSGGGASGSAGGSGGFGGGSGFSGGAPLTILPSGSAGGDGFARLSLDSPWAAAGSASPSPPPPPPLPPPPPPPWAAPAPPLALWALSLKVLAPAPAAVVGAVVADVETGFVLAAVACPWGSLIAASSATSSAAGEGSPDPAARAVEMLSRAVFDAALGAMRALAADAGAGRVAAAAAAGAPAPPLAPAPLAPAHGLVLCDTAALRAFWAALRGARARGAPGANVTTDWRWGCGGAGGDAARGGDAAARGSGSGPPLAPRAPPDAFPAPHLSPLPAMAFAERGAVLSTLPRLSAAAARALPSAGASWTDAADPPRALLVSVRDAHNVAAAAPAGGAGGAGGGSPLIAALTALQSV